jgi:hypothetical protein
MTIRMRYAAAPLLALALLGACGDDDEATDTTTTTTADGATDEGTTSDEFADVCALATEMDQQEDFPSDEQLAEYASLAPEDLQDDVATAREALSGHAGDFPALFAAVAEDDAEDAIAAINDFETENCGIDHEGDFTAHAEVDDSANRVDVTAVDYSFDFADTIPAGATSFVLTNQGSEAHFMTLTKIADGHTLDEALAFEGDPEEAGLVEDVEGGDSALAAPGGDDEEVMNVDLAPGNYAMLCFVSAADGTPHAFMGMVKEFTVE